MPRATRRARSGRRETRRRRGGRIVFSGSYGCAFRPAIRCKGEAERRPGMISKLMNKEFAQAEYFFKGRFEPIDPHMEYFYYPETMCVPDLTPNEEDNFSACTVLNARSKPTLLLSRDGGVDLSHIQLASEDYVPFFSSLMTLFDGLVLLHSRGVVHMDIKPPNIVSKRAADGSFITRYIDVGISDTISRAVERPPYDTYAYWPFDLRLIHPSFRSGRADVTEEMISDYYNSFMYNGPMFPSWLYSMPNGGLLTTTWCERFIQLAARGGFPKERVITGVDLFALGRTIAEVYARLTSHLYVGEKAKRTIYSRITGQGDRLKGVIAVRSANTGDSHHLAAYHRVLANRVSLPLYHLVADMIAVDPLKRISAVDAAARYRALLPHMSDVFAEYAAARWVAPLTDPGDAPVAGA